MAIPPFPSRDLAKLVLGYLAEEQLMTAYDELLQTSPYLDACSGSEYDRILMASLKNIVAEYRAVKIYVETCKPHLLRKKLLQCSNLLEVVKCLISHVDINRLHAQENTTEKISVKQSYFRNNTGCDICNSLNVGACVCKQVQRSVATLHPSQLESNYGSSTETTCLDDLPGNSNNRNNKNSKNEVVWNETILLNSHMIKEQASGADAIHSAINTTYEPHLPIVVNDDKPHQHLNAQDVSTVNSDEAQQKINNFNMYKVECGKSDYLPLPNQNNSSNDNMYKPDCNLGSFQEFAMGVSESSDKEISTVPDSSTAENFVIQNTVTKENKTNINPITNIKGPPKPQVTHKLATPLYIDSKKTQKTRNIKPKPEDQKIKIISDVKMPPLQPISSPLLHMQRIVINGTPAYKSNMQGKIYNKEEIMAMPTIILVPASGGPSSTFASVSVAQNIVHTVTTTLATTTTTTMAAKSLGPLIVDVSSNSPNPFEIPNQTEDKTSQEPNKIPVEMSLIKTVDFSHNSLPKDNNMAIANKTSTPNIMPPTRKSSSTPRRTSHIRVLDFTTPRRILHETINEQDPNIVNTDIIDIDNPDTQNVMDVECSKEEGVETKNVSTKENHIKKTKKNRDVELQAHIVKNDESIESTPRAKPKKLKTSKKKMSPVVEKSKKMTDDKAGSNVSCKKKVSPKTKKAKTTVKPAEFVNEPIKTVERVEKPIVKPTLNIISKSDWSTLEPKALSKENNESQTRINNSDEGIDTPEADRLSLQNVIGAKLNISELLETPYKQALYDIQMETPKFLGPDLPGEPVSDIKIMNIPTPRFFDSPKIITATPSSYSSRPTDYSSGGSYYKPDDHDFVPEILSCPVTVVREPSKDKKNEEKPKEEKKVEKEVEKEKVDKPGRPQRKCTRNVSYRSPINRTKDDGNSSTAAKSSSNTSIKDKKAKSIDSKNRSKSKPVQKKKVIPTTKSPFKKESLLKSTPNKYIKIKPFKTTPNKETSSKKKKTPSVLQTLSSKSLSRKRTSSKETNFQATPTIVPVTTKSRRKSSTPRKLDCTNSYKESVENTSSELSKSDPDVPKDCPQDSDIEQQPLRWSDDGSQDAKPKVQSTVSDEDEINKIKEFIASTIPEKFDNEGSFHNDLIKRGFDAETAKIIERDLLDTTPIQDTMVQSTSNDFNINKNDAQNVSDKLESDSSANNLQIVQEEEEEEIEMSVYECVEGNENFITCQFDEAKFVPKTDIPKLKDKFSIEVCIDDDESIRLRSTNFTTLFEDDPTTYNSNETEMAVSSISNFDKLYTPMKDRRSQCYEIFDSTLTSIDTPIKNETREVYETEIAEIVLEVESIEVKEKPETKKRKRITSEVAEESVSKKTKPDTQYLLNSANIQNIDIESVLSKLHGP